ncbi:MULTISPECIES: hypothetical protein [Saccharothrix]|uniref:hypothetical protein n=1 Tax=Saccharothrix TaxID=2071 RepID=UPI00095ACA55|nr:hypothetical protein [Saccharothrix sp. CB00851]OKI19835.1 hypothetical protein A6A25_38780 [Saccharothrix sp. CB00851]
MTTRRRDEEQGPAHDEATEADTVEQRAAATPVHETDVDTGSPRAGAMEAFGDDVTTMEADPADVAEQHRT